MIYFARATPLIQNLILEHFCYEQYQGDMAGAENILKPAAILIAINYRHHHIANSKLRMDCGKALYVGANKKNNSSATALQQSTNGIVKGWVTNYDGGKSNINISRQIRQWPLPPIIQPGSRAG